MGRRKAAVAPPPPVLMHLALFGDASSVTHTPQKTQLRARALSISFSRRFISSQGQTRPPGLHRASAVLGYRLHRRQQRAPVQSMSAHWQWHVVSARTSHEPQAEPHVQPVTAKPARGSKEERAWTLSWKLRVWASRGLAAWVAGRLGAWTPVS